jgi:hypothetical protein
VARSHIPKVARLSGKPLLVLWNALPGVEKRRKVGDRDELIDRLRNPDLAGLDCEIAGLVRSPDCR